MIPGVVDVTSIVSVLIPDDKPVQSTETVRLLADVLVDGDRNSHGCVAATLQLVSVVPLAAIADI